MRGELPRFARFVAVGGLAAALNIGARAALSLYMPFEWAVALAFPIALSFAFVANRSWVFTAGATDWRLAFWRFLLVNLAALAQVWLISVGLYRLIFPMVGFTWYPELVAHVVGVLSPVATSYYAHKHYSFKSAPTDPRSRPVR
jgi:putative flippase GtrA